MSALPSVSNCQSVAMTYCCCGSAAPRSMLSNAASPLTSPL